MKEVFKVDRDGYIVTKFGALFDNNGNCLDELGEDVVIEQPQGFYRPRWNGTEWVEDMTQEEIDELYKQPIKEPTEIEILKQEKEILAKSVYDLTTIVELILTGGIA